MPDIQYAKKRCLLISVGGSPEPIIYSIDTNKPDLVIYFCSRNSRKEIRSTIEPTLSHRPADTQIITTPDEQNLQLSVQTLVNALPGCLEDFGVGFDQLSADFTGGTKPMAAAVVLALADRGCRYSYVGGVGRDKEGLGVVLAGREQMLYADNPWDALGREPLRMFAAHFNRCRFTSAAQVAMSAAQRSEQLRPLFSALVKLAEAFASWDNFDHGTAKNLLSQCRTPLQTLPYLDVGQELTQLFADRIDSDLSVLEQTKNDMLTLEGKKVNAPSDGRTLLLDLLSNAIRRAEREHKYDDAASRLYSVIEKAAKIRLKLEYGIDNSKVREDVIPAAHRETVVGGVMQHFDGIYSLPLHRSFALLAALDDPLGHLYIQEENELKKVLNIRNHSLLAHGFSPVRQQTYENMLEISMRFVGIDRDTLPDFPRLLEP